MRQPLLKQQPILRLRRAQGTGQKSATPATLTKIILVLLTMILLPSAAWGQITVAGIESTGGTIEGSGITGTVTFNAGASTLTLNGATIDGSISYSGTNALTIALIGENTMNCGSSSMAFVSTNEVSLSFSTNSTDNGSLTISDYPSYNFDASNISTFSSKFTQISCSEGLVAVSVGSGTIIISNSYQINIGGVTVTTLNADKIEGSNISGTGTVKYVHDATNNNGTLYLTGVTISETGTAAITMPTSLRKLTINIQGSNTIKTTDNSAVIMCNRIDGSNTVEFSGTGSLTLERGVETTPYGGVTEYLTVDGSSYKDGLVPTYLAPENANNLNDATKAVITPYGLIIAGVAVTSANKDNILNDSGDPTAKFTPSTSYDANSEDTWPTLTLNSATINSGIIWNNSQHLKIELDGKSTVTNTGTNPAIRAEQSCSLSIKKVSTAESATLKHYVNNNAEFSISGFNNIITNSLNEASVEDVDITYHYYTTEPIYLLSIAGVQVHGISGELGYRENILKDEKATVTFDGSQTLTLNNAEIYSFSSTHAIETGLSTLNIDLKGNNSITTEGGYALYGQGTNLIIFTSSSDPVGNLTLKNYSGELAKLVTIQYDTNTGLVPTIITPSDASDLAAAREAIIAKGTALGITVAGVVVTNSNYTDIKGDGITGTKVSFTPADEGNETPAILTLNNASITGDVKFNDDLTVHLVGDNTITKPEDASSSSYAFDLSNIYNTLDFSTDETEPGTLKIVGSYSGLQDDGIIYNGQIKGGSATIGTTGDVIWKQEFSPDGVTPSYFILSLNKHYNLWKNGHQYHDLILDNNDGYVFNPEESTLTISSSSSSDYINSGLENLTIIVNGTQSMSYIAFGAPEDTQAEGITTGTLTITGKEDSESSSSINSLSLSNTGGGVITGFSSVDLTLPMHVSSPENFTGWTASVTSATITDETWDLSWKFEHGESYATYYYPDEDIYIPSTITPSVITEISGSTVKTQALSYIPKGVPVLLSKTNNTATTATFSKNLLKFAESDNPVTASESKVLYVLYNDQFVKVTPESEIYYGGYLDLTGVSLPANTRGLSIDGIDGTSAIDATIFEELNTEGDAWYDLQGRRIAKPTKAGLYIINGKKVVLK